MVKILITEPEFFNEKSVNILRTVGDVESKKLKREDLITRIPDVDVLVIRVETKLNKEILRAGKKLKIIATATTGVDHIDTEEAEKRGIEVINTPGMNTDATAEFTFALLLSLSRKIPHAFNSILDGKWNRNMFLGKELNNKTLGIIGFGRIGKKICNYAKAFGMNVVAHDPYVNETEFKKLGANHSDLDSLLKTSDAISVNAILSKETENLIDEDDFKKMKRGVILINTSRGKIVNENSMLDALNKKTVGGAALDVFENEPISPNNPLVEYARKNNNLILTPHLGGLTSESVDASAISVAEKIKEHLQKPSSQRSK